MNSIFVLKKYIRCLLKEEAIQIKEKKKNKKPGAGFILAKQFNNEWKFLGLLVDGKYDIPKGGIEDLDFGDRFTTAKRECEEECGIRVTPNDMLWGGDACQVGHITIFIASTDQEPYIQKNPKNGIFEHEAAVWLSPSQLYNNTYSYLKPAVLWAILKIKE